MRLSLLSVVLPLWLSAFFTLAAPVADSPCAKVVGRPCTALVLGGGGARGGAHVGVIKQLEAQQVPVDLIIGTSFGSFVGALYASGKSPAEIEKLMLATDWNAGYRDRVNRDEMPMRRKHQADDFNIQLGIGVGLEGAKLPAGVLLGQALSNLLRTALGSQTALTSFDELPIPFRAVAADLVSGQAVVLSQGDLATAIQASMSIPGVVQPMEIDGKLLVDGGIAAQVPVGIARALGAERVIAVEISSPGYGPDDLGSAVEIMDQLSYFLIRKNVEQDLALLQENDVLLIPELGDISTFNFDRLPESIAAGEKAARGEQPRIARLGVASTDYQQWQLARHAPPPAPTKIDRIVIDNRSLLDEAVIRQRLGIKEGDLYDQQQIASGIRNVYGLGTFERIRHEVRTVDNRQELYIQTLEKRWGPGYLDFQLKLENDFDLEQSHELGFAYTLTNLNRWGAEWRNELVFGSNRHLASEIYSPLYTSPLYLLGRVDFDTRNYVVRDSEGRSTGDLTIEDIAFTGALGLRLSDHHDLWFGLISHDGESRLPATVMVEDDNLDFYRRGVAAHWEYDSLDNASLPTRGHRWQARLERSRDRVEGEGDDLATVAELHWLGAIRLGDRHIVRASLRLQDYFNDDFTYSPQLYSLGGFLNLSGYPSNQLFGRHLRYGNLIYNYQVADNDFGAFKAPLYVGLSLESGNVWDKGDSVDYHEVIWASSLFVGWDSPLGPIYLAYGRAEGPWDSIYFYLGDTF
ncbi:MAG: patatin-like phospholipase family protein [Gammaproteobacteria bacterium]|nr:patatin-like phospholipase family protein [Gammaproteobacteria bacterium]